MSKTETVKRYGLFLISLFFSAIGVACSKHAELGVSPISSVANVLSCQFTACSLGTWLIIWNCVLILGQIILLRKQFQPIQLLQVPLSFIFGWFTDLGMWLVQFIPVRSYAVQLLLTLTGILILGFGIALSVIADVIMNSGEAFVKALADTIHRDFSSIKIIFDISCVVLALILSLICFDFRIIGTREGTVLAALLTGIVVRFFRKKLEQPLNRILHEK